MKPVFQAHVALLEALYRACLSAAEPLKRLSQWLPEPPKGRTVVLGLGKAAAAMALAAERAWSGPVPGVVAVPKGAAPDLGFFNQVEASHPGSDDCSLQALAGLGRARNPSSFS